jgi:phage anti-repressor protein
MNELINKSNQTPIEIALQVDESGTTTATKLYEFLELNQSNYSKWCKVNITENQFATENDDFFPFVLKYESLTGEKKRQDYRLTAAFAKKLSMTAKNEKGEQARQYFIQTEDKLKELTICNSVLHDLSPELQAIFAHDKKLQFIVQHMSGQDKKITDVDKDLQTFKMDMPILGIECDRITAAVKKKGVNCLGGKDSNAYQDSSLRGRVYSDIYGQLKREFGLTSYKAIKRCQTDMAVAIIEAYELPYALEEEINDLNAQLVLQ